MMQIKNAAKNKKENEMIQELDINENIIVINKENYSLSFSLSNGILSVERVSYEPLWRKTLLTGLVFFPTVVFLFAALYCIYASVVCKQYANNCLVALPFLILIVAVCLIVMPSLNALYSSKIHLDSFQYFFHWIFFSKRIRLENRKPILVLEICDSVIGGLLEGKVRIPRKGKLPPWGICVSLFPTMVCPSKELACKNARMIKEYISQNSNSLFAEIKIKD